MRGLIKDFNLPGLSICIVMWCEKSAALEVGGGEERSHILKVWGQWTQTHQKTQLWKRRHSNCTKVIFTPCLWRIVARFKEQPPKGRPCLFYQRETLGERHCVTKCSDEAHFHQRVGWHYWHLPDLVGPPNDIAWWSFGLLVLASNLSHNAEKIGKINLHLSLERKLIPPMTVKMLTPLRTHTHAAPS